MLNLTAMRPAAPLAPAFGSLKPDHRRKLRPVDRIKPFVLGTDRHRAFQRSDDFAPIRQTRLVRDSRQRMALWTGLVPWLVLGVGKHHWGIATMSDWLRRRPWRRPSKTRAANRGYPAPAARPSNGHRQADGLGDRGIGARRGGRFLARAANAARWSGVRLRVKEGLSRPKVELA